MGSSQLRTTNRLTSSEWSFGQAIAAVFFVGLGAVLLYFGVVVPAFEAGVALFEAIVLGPQPFSALGWGSLLRNVIWGGMAGFLIGLIRRRWRSWTIDQMVNIAASPRMISALSVGKWCVAVHVLVGFMSGAIVGLLGLVSPLHLVGSSAEVLCNLNIPAVAMLTGAGLFNAGGAPSGGSDLFFILLSITLFIVILTIIVSSITIPMLSSVVNGLVSGAVKGAGKSLGGSALVAITGALTSKRLQPFISSGREQPKGLSAFQKHAVRASLVTGITSGLWTGLINSLVVILCLYIARAGVVESLGHLPGLEEIDNIGKNDDLDGKTVAFGSEDSVIIVGTHHSTVALNFKTGQELWRTWKADIGSQGDSATTCVLNGRAVIIRNTDGGAEVWDVARNTRVRMLRATTSTSPTCASRADMVVAGSGPTLFLWGSNSEEPTRTILSRSSGEDRVGPIAISPDGTHVAAVYSELGDPRGIRIWDAASGKLLRTPATRTSVVNAVTFSPDGKLLVSGGGSEDNSNGRWVGEVTLWDVSSGRALKFVTIPALSQYSGVDSVVFSPDGTMLASTGTNATKVWAVR